MNEELDAGKPDTEIPPVQRLVRQYCGFPVEVASQQIPVVNMSGQQIGIHEKLQVTFPSELEAIRFMERSYKPNVVV